MTDNRKSVLVALLLTAAVLAVYGKVVLFDFVSLDDSAYVYENRHVLKGLASDSIRWAFTTTEAGNWHPLTWLSHMADAALYGADPAGHHWTNVMIHAANTVLLFFLFRGMTGALGKSAVVAALFALHPLHVESVAWVSERKEVLSTFMGLLALGAYLRYTRSGRKSAYLLCALFMALSLMAKPMWVTFPFLLILLDFWPLQRTKTGGRVGVRDLTRWGLEKIPLFLLSGAASVAAIVAQQSQGAVQNLAQFPFSGRVATAAWAYAAYLGKVFWPFGLSVYYPPTGLSAGSMEVIGAALLIVLLSAGAIAALEKAPYIAVGWFWYLGTLVPVIGLVQVGTQSMADRYMYLPLTGIFLVLVWGMADLAGRKKIPSSLAAAVAGVVLLLLAWQASSQVDVWRDNFHLYGHALQVDERNDLAHNNLGAALYREGRREAAAAHFQRAVTLNPLNSQAWINLGNGAADAGHYHEAALRYEKALAIDARSVPALYGLARALDAEGNPGASLERLGEALAFEPENAPVLNYKGVILARLGKWVEAETCFRDAVRSDPDFRPALRNLLNVQTAIRSKGRSLQQGP